VTEPTDIVFTRHRGRGVTIDQAPPRARIAVRVLTDRNAYLHMPTPEHIVFADQVVYQITGYADGALQLELAEDWRPAPTVQLPLTDEQAEDLKTKWKEQYGNGQAVHLVEVNREEESGRDPRP
jgi:aminoglycoside/choline kinase family phosphotransferase